MLYNFPSQPTSLGRDRWQKGRSLTWNLCRPSTLCRYTWPRQHFCLVEFGGISREATSTGKVNLESEDTCNLGHSHQACSEGKLTQLRVAIDETYSVSSVNKSNHKWRALPHALIICTLLTADTMWAAAARIAAVMDCEREPWAIMNPFPLDFVSQDFITSAGKASDMETYSSMSIWWCMNYASDGIRWCMDCMSVDICWTTRPLVVAGAWKALMSVWEELPALSEWSK